MMSVDTERTERFVTEQLRHAVKERSASPLEVYTALKGWIEYATRDEAFDWNVLRELVNPDTNTQATIASDQTSFVIPGYPARMDGFGRAPQEVHLHTEKGTFAVVDALGRLAAFKHVSNPDVPAEYGPEDPWAWKKINEALYVDRVLPGASADHGIGYGALTILRRQLGEIGPKELPHIGHATIYAETTKELVGFAGSTGRTLSRDARSRLASEHPVMLARMVGGEPHPDDLAGLLDSLSGSIAGRVALLGATANAHLIELPSPYHPDHVFVDWN